MKLLLFFLLCLLCVMEVASIDEKLHDLAYYELVKVNDERPSTDGLSVEETAGKAKGNNLEQGCT